jgi:hypothetical protein
MPNVFPKRTVKRVYRRRMNDGLGMKFRVQATLLETDYFIDGEWKCGFVNAKEWVKLEKAIEKKYPGWFHTCNFLIEKTEQCLACHRQKLIQQLKRWNEEKRSGWPGQRGGMVASSGQCPP